MKSTQNKQTAPYGLWDSPITPQALAQGKRLQDLEWDSESRTLVWLEGRSDRGVLVAQSAERDAPRDLSEAHSVRARVGYGGGDFTVAGGDVYYVEAESGRLYRLSLGQGPPQAITPAYASAASPTVSPDLAWLVYVYHYEGRDGLAVVDTKGKQWPGKLASNADFFMHPAWHPSGQWLAWIAWDHPHMPWDETRLVLGKLDQAEGHKLYLLEQQALIDQGDVAIAEPHFTSDGRYLLYLSDASGWPNLYRYDLQTQEHIQITKEKAEIGGPAWTQAQRHYVYDAKNQRIIYLRNRSGQTSLWHVSLQGGNPQPLVTPMASYTDMSQPTLSPNSTQLALIASASDIPPRVVSTHLDDSAGPRIHAFSTAERVQSAIYSRPESIAWEAENGDTVHGLFYPPHNPGYEGRGAPPLLVMVHGGPTGQSTTAYQGRTQFFTSRGFAVLDVNYRGSTGYGKEYMKKLRGNWGIYDVADVVSGAEYVVCEGRADGARMVIMGGSAGGFTVLLALAQHPGFFKAGICSYGVSNLFTLAADTHKFEAHYLDSMVGPLPEAAERYRERSAYFLADQIQDPLAVFQGEEDRVVPKEQSDSIVETLRRRGVPHTYHVYAGEGHGWRKSETISDYYEAIMRFLRQYVIFG